MERLLGYLRDIDFWMAIFAIIGVLFKDSIPGLQEVDWAALATALVVLFGGRVQQQKSRSNE